MDMLEQRAVEAAAMEFNYVQRLMDGEYEGRDARRRATLNADGKMLDAPVTSPEKIEEMAQQTDHKLGLAAFTPEQFAEYMRLTTGKEARHGA